METAVPETVVRFSWRESSRGGFFMLAVGSRKSQALYESKGHSVSP